MIIFLFFLDLFFYNYTSFSTCFFLLTFFKRKISLISLSIIGILFDFFIIHTYGIFSVMLLYFYYIMRVIKGSISDLKIFLLRFLIMSLSFIFFSLIIFNSNNLYLYGLFFNFIILLFCVIFCY